MKHYLIVILLTSSFCLANSALAQVTDREILGEECYQLFHRDILSEKELSTEKSEEDQNAERDARLKCLSKKKDIPAIVVTPMKRPQDIRRAPASVGIVNSRQIERSGADSLAEVVRDVPGVEISDAGQAGQKRIRIRGEESRRVAILIDGQEFADEREVGTPLLLAPEMVERVEIVRGSGSVLHGSRAIGGVVNFITKKGGYHPVQGSASSLYDSSADGSQSFASVYGGQNGFEYRAAGTVADYNDRDTAAGDLDNTSFNNQSYLLYGTKHWDDHKLSLSYDDYQSDSEVYVDPVVATTPPFLDFQVDSPQRDRSKAAAFYDWEPMGETLKSVHLNGFYQENKREFNTFSDTELDLGAGPVVNSTSTFSDSTLNTYGTNLQSDFSLGSDHYLITGVTAKYDDLDQRRRRTVISAGTTRPTEVVTDKGKQQAVEIFAQDQWEFIEDFSLIFGSRAYYVDSKLDETTRPGLSPNSTDDQHLIGAAGLQYQGLENTNIWLNWSQGYIYPTLINTATGAFAGPDFVNPNPDLDPETSNSAELGLRYDDSEILFDSAIFYTWAEDYIDHLQCSEVSAVCLEPAVGRRDRVYVNVDKVRSFGAESLFKYALTEILSPYANISLIRRRFESVNGQTYKTGIPTFAGRFGVELERRFNYDLLGWADFYLRTATDSDELDNGDRITHKAGWGTLNAAFGLEIGYKQRLRVTLDLLNLGDKEYTPGTENLIAPGRSAIINFSLDV